MSGGTANSTTVNSHGYLYVSSGGTANSTTVNSGGRMYISSGGTALDVAWTPCVGGVSAADGAVVTYTSQYSGVYFGASDTLLSSAMTMILEIVSGGAEMYVMTDGTADKTTVDGTDNDVYLHIRSGGVAYSTTVKGYGLGRGYLHVSDGGIAINTTVNYLGSMCVFSGGTANNTTVDYVGDLHIFRGGVANDTTVGNGNSMTVFDGGSAAGVTVNGGGHLYVASSGSALNVVWTPCIGHVEEADGAVVTYTSQYSGVYFGASDTLLSSAMTMTDQIVGSSSCVGCMYVMASGAADRTTVSGWRAAMYVSDGGTAKDTTLDSGTLHIFFGGTANSTTINSAGFMHIHNSALVNNTMIRGGELHISSGGAADSTTMSGGRMYVSGGTANSTTVDSNGFMIVSSGGTANGTTVTGAFANLYVSSGGTVSFTNVNGGGSMVVLGGVANSTTVNGGDMYVDAGGTANDTAVNSGGEMTFGGKITGVLTIESGAVVSALYESIIDFDISSLNPDNEALINDVSLIVGSPTYTLTVSMEQSEGTYTLAGGAVKFNETITVESENETYGDLTVNGPRVTVNGLGYALTVKEDILLLTVGGTGITVTADITTPTNRNVTVTAVFAEEDVQKQYSFDNSTWNTYTAPVVMTENGTVYFRFIDGEETVSDVVSYTVANIDKVAPEAPLAVADITVPTKEDVTVTATFSEDSILKEYSLDGTVWSDYASPIVMTANGTVSFRGVDAAGNISETTSYVVSNIYKTAPVLTVTGNPESWTNQDVTLTAESDEEAEIEYSFDNAAWTAGTEVTVTENKTVYFRATDPAGNVTAETVVVDKIDKIPPETPAVSTDILLPTNKDVTVTAEFSEDSAQKLYSLDGETWLPYTSGVVMTENGTLYFRGIDEAGNVSQVTEYVVSNIDKTLPDAPEVSAGVTSPTQGNVTVTAVFGGDVAEKLYGFDGETWLAYTSPVVVTENGTVYFKSVGSTGKSAVTAYEVVNIDRTAPVLTVSGNPADWTNKDVTLTAASDEEAGIEYSFDNANWTAGQTVTVGENATVYFRATDAAGNVSTETVVVDKIDKIPPEAPEISVDVTKPTSGTVTVRAAYGADAARKEYSPDGTTWLDYAGGVTLSSNGTVYFRAVDAAGNISDLSSRTVTNIIKGAVVFYSSGIDSTELISAADVMSGKTVDSAGNLMRVNSGGLAAAVSVNSGGRLYVMEGGSADAAAVNAGGRLYVSSGGTALETAVSSGGRMYVCSGGMAEDLSVAPRGSVFISSGASVVDASVGSGGKMYVSGGGKVTGRLDLASGAVVSAFSGGVIDFDLSPLAPGNAALVTDLARLRGTPDFTVTVSPTQTEGLYGLADGAADFGQIVIIVRTDAGRSLGTVSVGNTVTLAGRDYTLGLASDALTLTVAGDPVISGLPGDLNGDGRADIIMTVTEPGHGAEGATGAWLIQSDQTAVWGDLSQRNAGWEIFGTGVTAAGKTANDVYVKSTGNVIGAWVTDDTGHVSGWETVGQFDEATQILGLGDFNADGQTDLLLRNDNGAVGCYFTSGEKTGWNYFQSLGDEWRLAAVGDFNADGRADVVLVHDAGFAGTWLTQADGTVAWADLDTLGEGFSIAGCGDFDGDGTDDVLLRKGTCFGAWLVENGGAKSWFGLGDLGDVTVEQIADFDGDGKDDLRIRTSAGDLGTQLVRGADTLEWRYYGSVGEEWSTRLAAI